MGLYNFVGTAIDNIGGTLHFDGTEDGVENGSLDWEEDKPLRITAWLGWYIWWNMRGLAFLWRLAQLWYRGWPGRQLSWIGFHWQRQVWWLGLGGIADGTADGSIDFEGTVADGTANGSIDFDGTEDGMEDGVLASDKIEKVKFDGLLDLDSTANWTGRRWLAWRWRHSRWQRWRLPWLWWHRGWHAPRLTWLEWQLDSDGINEGNFDGSLDLDGTANGTDNGSLDMVQQMTTLGARLTLMAQRMRLIPSSKSKWRAIFESIFRTFLEA
jgi:hypothetical protein